MTPLTELPRIVAVINGKGGTGKTSVAANLAGLLAASDYRVLAVGLDPQGNLPLDLGMIGAGTADDGREFTMACMGGRPIEPVRDVRKSLDVVPDGTALKDLAAVLASRQATGTDATSVPAQLIRDLAAGYDITFLDCPPGEEQLQKIALRAATYLVIPTKTDNASRAGLRLVADRFQAVCHDNPSLCLLGTVMFGVTTSATRTLAEARQLLENDLAEDDTENGAEMVFAQAIRHVESTAVRARSTGLLAHELEAAAKNQGPWWKGLRSKGEGERSDSRIPASAQSLADDYYRLAEELLARIQKAEALEEVAG